MPSQDHFLKFIAKSGEYEGPLNVLLSLITERKLHVSEISLLGIIDDFIEHTSHTNYDDRQLLSFLGILSTLLLIKSRALLPSTSLSQEDQNEIKDLTTHLEIYSIIKSASEKISIDVTNISNEIPRVFSSPITNNKSLNIPSLQEIFQTMLNLLENIHLENTFENAFIPYKKRLEDTIDMIKKYAQRMGSFEFNQLRSSGGEDTVIQFLALLEMHRMGIVDTHQKNNAIIVEWSSVTLPHYGI